MLGEGKLVRDKIPEIIRANGNESVTRVLSSGERLEALLHKLVEEALEMQETPTLEERADVQEVLRAIDRELGWGQGHDVAVARQQKFDEQGGFFEGIFLERIVEIAGIAEQL